MNQHKIKAGVFAFLSGGLFALGLGLSGMTQPAKVQGFLNAAGVFNPAKFGVWDASLAFVMGGALLVTFVAFIVTPRRGAKPWLSAQFDLPTRTDIDAKLIAGAALFGIGWGLAGYCPGPALASLLTGGVSVVLFVAAMFAGFKLAKLAV